MSGGFQPQSQPHRLTIGRGKRKGHYYPLGGRETNAVSRHIAPNAHAKRRRRFSGTKYKTMTPFKQFQRLPPVAKEIITDYARRRGMLSDGLADFLLPILRLERVALHQASPFIARLTAAVKNHERILIFGDYDADGITATTILLRCLRETAGITPMWSLPNRQFDHYGLDLIKAQSLRQQYQPTLLICLDNGTNSSEAIQWLKQEGVETIVCDHHPLEGSLPETIVVNPKAHGGDKEDLCAAGLALLVCHELTCAWKAESLWNRDGAILLAGIGTMADAVRLTPLNRAITKTAIALMNDAIKVTQIPGLAALIANVPSQLNQRQLQFDIIPALNAPGRLGSAEPVVTLLTTADFNQARSIAAHCREQNERRKQIQREMVRQASGLAEAVVNSHSDAAVLVLAGRNWHHGVAGPAASQIAETYRRSVILLAPHGDHDWKGSGRSANGDHLGNWLRAAKALGLVERGGGHAAAVGLALTPAQLAPLQSAALLLPMPQTDAEPTTEFVGEIDQLPTEEWAAAVELLAPFGRCNPFPVLRAPGARLQGEPVTLQLKDNGQPWAIRAEFKMNSGRRLMALWRDVDAARKQWTPGARCDLTLELSIQARGGKTYYNWSVVSFQSTEETKPDHRD